MYAFPDLLFGGSSSEFTVRIQNLSENLVLSPVNGLVEGRATIAPKRRRCGIGLVESAASRNLMFVRCHFPAVLLAGLNKT